MLELVVKAIMAIILVITGTYIVASLTKQKFEFRINHFLLLSLVPIVTVLTHKVEYTFLSSILPYLTMIVIFKYIFKIGFSQSILVTSIMMAMIMISDIIVSSIFVRFVSIEELRSTWYILIIANLLVSMIACLLSKIPIVKNWCKIILDKIEERRYLSTIIFSVLLIVVIAGSFYNVYANYVWSREYFANLVVMLTFYVMMYIFMKEQTKHEKLNHEYDSLFEHVQSFEEWIESEQVNRHEFKNQLMTLNDMIDPKNKKAKAYIESILKEQLEIGEHYVEQLKNVPKCGLKGLFYYKIVQAQKEGITITTEISDKVKSCIKKLDENEIKLLCRLVGIYFDNAIEAASICSKKNISVEMYVLSKQFNIVIMNTFEKNFDIKTMHKKGVSSKGTGRGNGLHFANNILKKQKNFHGESNIINDYYVQKIMVDTK